MTLWTAPELAAIGRPTRPFAATGISIDTRTLAPGDLFIALGGESRDGHAFVATALAQGAAGAMVSRPEGLPAGAPLLVVDDTLASLTALGAAGRARFQGRLVAITGSVGKTTVKEMLRRALAPFGPVHAAHASYNNHWGVPLTLARLPQAAAFCIAEIGMNHPGEIAPLARLAQPDVAVITAIADAHIGNLGSLAAIAAEKAALLGALRPGGTAILPAAEPLLAPWHPGARLFGTRDTTLTRLGPPIEATVEGTPVRFTLAATGEHMAHNALATLAACAALGLDPIRAAAALDGFTPIAGRGLQRPLPSGATLLDESYNASPASVRAALATLATMPGRRIAVLGDMLELGAFGPDAHRALAPEIASAADLLYTCGPLTRLLFDAVPDTLRAAHADTAASLAPLVAAHLRPGDAVLVKGSLGSRMRQIVDALEQV